MTITSFHLIITVGMQHVGATLDARNAPRQIRPPHLLVHLTPAPDSMGAGASSGGRGRAQGAHSKAGGSATHGAAASDAPEFECQVRCMPCASLCVAPSHPVCACQPRLNLDDCPARIVLRVGAEALSILDARNGVSLRFCGCHTHCYTDCKRGRETLFD